MIPYCDRTDDFCVFVNLRSKLDLPSQRETVLHFFESLRRSFPSFSEFDRRESGEFFLEESPEVGPTRRFLSMEANRLSSGIMNPEDLAQADEQHRRMLELAPFHLGLSSLDCDTLEVVFSFDLDFSGNHDSLVAETLTAGSPLGEMLRTPGGRLLFFQPSMTFVLDESCRLQWTLAFQTRTDAFQLRTGQFPDLPISVYLTVQQFWAGREESFADGYTRLRGIGKELLETNVGPRVLAPLAEAIEATR